MANEYLRSILVPEGAPVSIPDDNLRRHTVRQETITASVKANATGRGYFLFYPNNPTSLVGAHYTFNEAASAYRYDKSIISAQQLQQSYNYARKTSGIIYVKSATLPSGVYNLSGTFNAATYEGPPSELDLQNLDFQNILATTSNSMDKVGQVGVSDGVAVLSLPAGFGLSYVRLQDKSPSKMIDNSSVRINDFTENLMYSMEATNYTATVTGGTPVTLANFNIDSNLFISMTGSLQFTFTPDAVPPTNILLLSVAVEFLGVDGDVAASEERLSQIAYTSDADEPVPINVGGLFMASYPNDNIIGTATEPIAGMRITVSLSVDGKITNEPALTNTCEVHVTSHGAARPGLTSPVTIVMYDGVSDGATITVSGVANYELIPNPELAKNIPTKYSNYDNHGLDYVKRLMANRERLRVRSVTPIYEYKDRIRLYEEMSRMDNSVMTEALAFGIGDVLRFIRSHLPAVADFGNSILPGSGDVLRGIDRFVGHTFLGEDRAQAASGRLIGRAASGQVVGSTLGSQLRKRGALACDVLPIFLGDNKWYATPEPDVDATREYRVETGKRRVAIFPALLFQESDGKPDVVGTQLYAAIEGRFGHLPFSKHSVTRGNRTVYGIAQVTNMPDGPDTTVVPIKNIRDGVIYTRANAPIPSGGSMEAALAMLPRLPPGIAPFAVTGNAIGDTILKNQWRDLKYQNMKETKLPLLGAEEYDTITDLINKTSSVPRLKHLDTILVSGRHARAMDDEEFLDADEDVSLPEPAVGKYDEGIDALDIFLRTKTKGKIKQLQDILKKLVQCDELHPNTINGMHYTIMLLPGDIGATPQAAPLNNTKSDADSRRARLDKIKTNMAKQGINLTDQWIIDHNYRGPNEKEIGEIRAGMVGNADDMARTPERMKKAVRLAGIYQSQGYKDITVDWIVENKFKGPTADQLSELPHTRPSVASSEDLIKKILENNLGQETYNSLGNEMQLSARNMVREMVERNGGRGLNIDQVRHLNSVYAGRKYEQKGHTNITVQPVQATTDSALRTAPPEDFIIPSRNKSLL